MAAQAFFLAAAAVLNLLPAGASEPGWLHPASGIPTTLTTETGRGMAPGRPKGDASTTWDLPAVLAYALDHSPELRGQNAELLAAGERVRQARFQRRPSLGLEGGYDWNRFPQRLTAARSNGEAGTFDDDLWRADLVLKVPLDASGRLSREVAAASLRRRAAAATADRVRQDLVLSVSVTFFRILGQKALIAALEFSRRTM